MVDPSPSRMVAASHCKLTRDPARDHWRPIIACRRALTLVEMLVSVTLTLLVVLAIVQVFEFLGDSVSLGRATIEMAGQLRSVSNRLQLDLDNRTCPVKPWIDPGSGLGYFECIEGGQKDDDLLPSALGDRDDVLAFTVRSSEPFVGRYNGSTITSHVAEVIWFPLKVEGSDYATLVRRVLLVRPDLQSVSTATIPLSNYFRDNDVSVRIEAGEFVPNSLSDLTRRANRAHHWLRDRDVHPEYEPTRVTFFPGFNEDGFDFNENGGVGVSLQSLGTDLGDWIILSDVAAFDVKVFDADAEVRAVGDVALIPSDPGHSSATSGSVGSGAFIDLGWTNSDRDGQLQNLPVINSTELHGNFDRPDALIDGDIAYDTWSLAYERDGVDQDDDGDFDEGFDGIDSPDDDGNLVNGVDDLGERETSPPYPVPLRGIEVKIRMIEVSTQQVRQVSVVGDFTDF